MARYILGVTGASGAIYASRTAMHLKRLGHEVSLIVTAPGRDVVEFEGQGELFIFLRSVLAGVVIMPAWRWCPVPWEPLAGLPQGPRTICWFAAPMFASRNVDR